MNSELTYNPDNKEVLFLTQEGVEIILRCPKMSVFVNLRRTIDPEFLDDMDMLVRYFSYKCIANTNFTFDDYLDLSIKDGIMLTNVVKIFVPSTKLFNIWSNISSDKGLAELRKVLLMSVNNDTYNYFNLLKQDIDDVVVLLNDWMEIKMEEYHQTTGKKHPLIRKQGMSGLELINLGIDENVIMKAIEKDD